MALATNRSRLAFLTAFVLSLALFTGAARQRVSWASDEPKARVQIQKLIPESDSDRSVARDAEPCGRDPDEICSLPGLNGNPHVRMRSGYVTVSEESGRRLWYLVAEREEEAQREVKAEVERKRHDDDDDDEGDEDDDDDDNEGPVVLWLTGGPGCSTLDAFIYEHGPFRFSYGDQSEAIGQQERPEEAEGGSSRTASSSGERPVVLSPNPFSWTKLATVIYVDSPAGVGMSYSGNPDVDYHTNDQYTIADLVTFLEGLTQRYPQLASAPFFLAGESYGGVFVPLLARELVRVNRRRQQDGRRQLVNLRGYSVGNPVTDDVIDGNAQLFFAADMGYVDPPTWRNMRRACGDMFWNATFGSECWDAQSVIKDDLWDLNWYDVLDPCTRYDDHNGGAAGGKARGSTAADAARRFFWPYTSRMRVSEPELQKAVGVQGADAAADPGAGEGASHAVSEAEEELEEGRRGGRRLWGPWLRHVVPCMDRRIAMDWLNRESVRSALHAAPHSVIGEWQPCSDVLYYRLDTMDLVPVHEDMVQEGLRVLVYSGDHDMVVPHTGTRMWLYDKAQLGGAKEPLRPWMMNGQIAGFTARFRAGTGLMFATVKGAGHMVPQSRPEQALHLLRTFLYDDDL